MTFEFPRERAVQGDVDYFSYSPASDSLRPLLNDPEEDCCDETAGTDDFDDPEEDYCDETAGTDNFDDSDEESSDETTGTDDFDDSDEGSSDETTGSDDFDDSDEEFSDKTTADWHEDEASGRPVAYYPKCNQRSGLRDDSLPLPLAFLLLLLFFYMGYNDRDSTALKLSCRTGVQ